MTKTIIFHNPRCSKSRQTLALLEQHDCQIEVLEYLKTPPTVSQLQTLMSQLGITDARAMMRTKEDEYKQQNLSDENLSTQQLLEAITMTPKLLERPIVVVKDQARIGRPPESVLDIL